MLCCPNIHSTCTDLPIFIFIQAVGYHFHKTHTRCAMLSTRTSQLAQGVPALCCCLKAWACLLLATGVRGDCAALEWDRLVDWLKTSLKEQLACKLIWPAVIPCLGYLPPGFAVSLCFALLSPFCSATAAVLANIKLTCVRAGWAPGQAETEIAAVLYGHTTTAVSSLHLYSLSFLALFFPCIKYSVFLAMVSGEMAFSGQKAVVPYLDKYKDYIRFG